MADEPFDFEGEMDRFVEQCILTVQTLAPGPNKGEHPDEYRERVSDSFETLLFARLTISGRMDADIVADPGATKARDVNEALCDLAFTNGVLRRFNREEVMLPRRPGKR